ncbi:MAG: TIGR03790 family protein [Verrucomicrobiae bacterium]|nr:TIGR03790 family protein [Verrucomicrobiae bacterium]
MKFHPPFRFICHIIRAVCGWMVTGGVMVLSAHGAAHPEAHRVLLVHNANEPGGLELAEHYRQLRGVPTNNMVAIRTRVAETITREEFQREILEPLRGVIRERPSIYYVVTFYGVPLRIEHDPTVGELPMPENSPAEFQHNRASVDSDLAVLLRDGVPLRGAVTNPFFGWRGAFGATTLPRRLALVGRLDGPDPATVRRMMDDAVRIERVGLAGRVYLDARGIQNGDGYQQGDDWLRDAAVAFREAGFEVELDERGETLPADAAVTDAAVYAGWYAHHADGPFAREDFQFLPGAVAYHIHSFSAASVRTRTAHWCGPLLARGAAVTAGNVYEPYLSLTPHVNIWIRRLLDGSTWIEALYASVPALSWQTTMIGDPLYRPFAVSIGPQLAMAERDEHPYADWVFVRHINLLRAQGRNDEALTLARQLAEQRRSATLWEKVGDLLMAEDKTSDAIEAYRRAWEGMPRGWAWVRVGRKLADLETARANEAAAEIYRRAVVEWVNGVGPRTEQRE